MVGAVVYDLARARLEVIRAKVIILATGGYGRAFAKTTNGHANTGDGMAIAFRAGAVLSDMEFVQFHPTTLYGTNILISEAARGEGGYLRNTDGERFMARYAPEKMELAPRDVVARAIFKEIKEGRGFDGHYVHLDLTHLGEALVAERLPQVRDLAIRYGGVDPVSVPMPIEPAQHYSMGGVRTDNWGVTTLPGLLAAGEVANVSVHGANRLGGNSLLETVVFGRRAGNRAVELARGDSWPDFSREALRRALEPWQALLSAAPRTSSDGDSTFAIRREMTTVMTNQVGVFRTGSELEEAVDGPLAIAGALSAPLAARGSETLQLRPHGLPRGGLSPGSVGNHRPRRSGANRKPRGPLPPRLSRGVTMSGGSTTPLRGKGRAGWSSPRDR